MIVTTLVLGAVLLSILGLMISFIAQRRVRALDESSIATAAQLDAAMAIQRSMRIAELRRRMTDINYWSYALLGLAFLLQIVALAVDHNAHPSIAVIGFVPAFFIVLTAHASRRRYAQRQLETYLRDEPSSRLTL
jgi:hypothetical protein